MLIAVVSTGSVYALFALGYALTFGVTGVFNFAHPVVFAAGALAAVLLVKAGHPLWLAAVVGALAGGIAGVVLDRIVQWPLRLRAEPTSASLIATAGAGVACVGIAAAFFGSRAVIFPAAAVTFAPLHAGSANIGGLQLVTIALGLTGIVVVQWVLRRTRLGTAIRAVAGNRVAARAVGVNVEALVAQTMFLASALGALGGVAFAVNSRAADIQLGFTLQLTGIATAVLGGLGSVTGTIVAAYVVALIDVLVAAALPGIGRDVVAFGIVLIVLAVLPRGLLPGRDLRPA